MVNPEQTRGLNLILVHLLIRKHNGYLRIREQEWKDALPELVKHKLEVTTKDGELVLRVRRVDPGEVHAPTD